ncbi:MAG: hypothetical protein AAGI17_07845 [Planctomycetota bacterium]
MQNRFAVVTAIAALAVPATLTLAQLTPPAGPVSDSFKSIDEAEPRTPLVRSDVASAAIAISAPGSYYLGEPIELPSLARFANIPAPGDVTIDLNGFEINSPDNAGFMFNIAPNGTPDPERPRTITIRNGTLTGGFATVTAPTSESLVIVLEDLVIKQPQQVVNAQSATIIMRRCTVTGPGVGVLAPNGNNCVFDDVTFDGFTGRVIHVNESAQLSKVAINQGATADNAAVDVGDGSRIEHTTIRNLSGPAITTGNRPILSHVLVDTFGSNGSTMSGVTIGFQGNVSGCTFTDYRGSGTAVAGTSESVFRAIVIGNAQSSTQAITIGNSSNITGCMIDDAPIAIVALLDCIIRNNIAEASATAIVASESCVIDLNKTLGDIVLSNGRNVVTRNTLSFGSIQSSNPSNRIGPDDDVNSPWANFTP